MSDLNSFSATDAQHFFDEYYIPSNMVVAVVGDVKASEALPIIEKYFGRIPSRERARRAHHHRAAAELRAPRRAV